MENPSIRLLLTGGTIDSAETYDPAKKSVFSDSGTYLSRMLKESRVTADVQIEVLMLKDSNDLTEEDRFLISDRCIAAAEQHVVITHGTDTVRETAEFLGKRLKSKIIVLTGSMIPFSIAHSDALFNLGYALASSQRLPNGVYVAMNGRIFEWNNVRKNKDIGVFEERQ